MALLGTSQGYPFSPELSLSFSSHIMHYSPALILYSGHCEQSLIIWIYFCPCSHLTLYLGKSRFYWPISRGAYSHLRRWMSFLCTFLTHVPFCAFTTSDFLLDSGIYWAWIMAICIQYKLPLFFFYSFSSMRSKSLFYSLVSPTISRAMLGLQQILTKYVLSWNYECRKMPLHHKKGTELAVWHLSCSHNEACDIHLIILHLSCFTHKTGKSKASAIHYIQLTQELNKLMSMKLLWIL